MKVNRALGVLIVAAVLPMAGCENDGTDPVRGELSADEAKALSAAMAEDSYRAAAESAESGDPQAAYVPQSHGGGHYTGTAKVTAPCSLGGKVERQATVTIVTYPEEERFVLDLEGSQKHDGCVFIADGTEFEVTGNPSLVWNAHLEAAGGEPIGTQTLDLEGGFVWSADDGREGECEVDIAVVFDPETNTRTMNGNFCGVEIETTETWTVE